MRLMTHPESSTHPSSSFSSAFLQNHLSVATLELCCRARSRLKLAGDPNPLNMNNLIAIFPLEVVVYPGDELNLHVFEPRYKQLINDCAKTKMPFGIPAVVDRKLGGLGTLVQLNEVMNVQPDGQMDIRTGGLKLFRIVQVHKNFPGKLYSAAEVDFPENDPSGDPKIMRKVLAAVKKLHGILNVQKKFTKSADALVSYDVAHHIGLSLKQEYELLGLFAERARQEYLLRHLQQVLPVVADMEALKEKIHFNGHFKNLPGFDL